MTITITHDAESGTTIDGDVRPYHQIVKDGGFRWSRRESFWYLPNSRDRLPRTATIEGVATRLRTAGLDVAVEVDAEQRPIAEREAARTERIEDRQEGLAAKADKLETESDTRYARAKQIGDMIPFGQPILVGHHSERRHRNDIAKMRSNMDKSVEAYREQKDTERKIAGSQANQRQRESAPTTIRRIKKLSADLRVVERNLAGNPCLSAGLKLKADAADRDSMHCRFCGTDVAMVDRTVAVHYSDGDRPAAGGYLAQLTARQTDYTEQIAYWQAHLATLEEAGVKLWGPADFVKGDFVNYWGGWREVVRVNAKTLTVKTDYTWTDKLPYDKVKGQRPAA